MGLLNDLHELKVRDNEVLIEARNNLFLLSIAWSLME